MTHIITHNNTRYRSGDPCDNFHHQDEVFIQDGRHIYVETNEWGRCHRDCVYADPLPFIPDWPGCRPEQYLANSTEQPDCPVHTGDLIAFVDPDPTNPSAVILRVHPTSPPTDTLGEWTPTGERGYLISRANPEHDAEDTQ